VVVERGENTFDPFNATREPFSVTDVALEVVHVNVDFFPF
jgi:hypothetical protein